LNLEYLLKTQQQAQDIFNILVIKLQGAHDWNLLYISKNVRNWRKGVTIDTPLEHFLKSTKNLAKEEVSEEFLSRVYAEAFHTGSAPKNRNHIAMTCGLEVHSNPKSPVLSVWVDLDKVATQLNTYLRINPPYRFEVRAKSSGCAGGTSCNGKKMDWHIETTVNSAQNPSSININFLLNCIISVVSVYVLLIAALAVASIITLSTAGIFTAVGLMAGGASYCFFKARADVNTTEAPIEEPHPEKIEDIFRNHFAATIGESFLPQERVEILDDKQALGI
jgi:hypothetical protein